MFRIFRLPLGKVENMTKLENSKTPTKMEQMIALKSYSVLSTYLNNSDKIETEIEIEETKERLKIPNKALKLLAEILKSMSEGKPISIVPEATEVTTQKAAEILGCSRPHLVKLLEDGKINYTKVGKHRRILFEDILNYKKEMKIEQKKHIIEMMNFDEENGLYDSQR